MRSGLEDCAAGHSTWVANWLAQLHSSAPGSRRHVGELGGRQVAGALNKGCGGADWACTHLCYSRPGWRQWPGQ